MMSIAFTASLLGALAAVPAAAAPPPADSVSPETLSRIERYFQKEVQQAGFPGASLAVVEGDQVVLSSAVGVRDIDTREPVTPDTVFCIGSVTKSFTATALLQLRDAGKVDLDAPVTRYLPWFQVADPGEADKITLRELLTHTSGLPTNSHSVVWQNEAAIRNSIDHAVRALKQVHLHTAPGTQFEYANMNYVVLGRVIEAVSGMPWSQYVTEHILMPAGMTHSTTRLDEAKPLATSYWPEFGRLTVEPLQVGGFMAPASNILATAPDLARYAAAHMGTEAPLLKHASLVEAHLGGAVKSKTEHYAFGWINEKFDGVTVVHHGGAAGHAAEVWMIPERKLAVVMLFGAYSHVDNDRIAQGVVALALGKKPPPIHGLSEIATLLWTSRSLVGVIFFCPLTLMILPIVRRRYRRVWNHHLCIMRAAFLVAAAGTLWFLVFRVLPENIPEFPLPFGFHGWFTDLAVVSGAVLLTATAWAFWAVAMVIQRARSIAAVRVSAPNP